MTDREAMKLALEALELYQSKMSVQMFDAAITALRQALEQPSDIDAAVLAEREACSEVCESMRPSKQEYDQRFYTACTLCANAIRARGENNE
jgi:hypothetical protein